MNKNNYLLEPFSLENLTRYKNLNSLDKFKQQIKMWEPTTCTYKLCKAY